VTGLLPLLAHAGPGSTWQALLVAVSLGLVVIVALTVLGRIEVGSIDDLVLPLAAVAILSSAAPLADYWLSDWIGWAFPIGVTMLVGLLLAAFTSLDLTLRSPLTWGAVGVAAVGAALLYQPLTIAWHPPPDYLPLATDARVEILVPDDGDVVEAGTLEVSVVVEGGSIGPGGVALEDLPADAEEAGGLAVTLDGERIVAEYLEDCTVAEPCTTVTFPVELEAGEHDLYVEFTRGDGMPLAPQVVDRVRFTSS
jgi:hypothetical protein